MMKAQIAFTLLLAVALTACNKESSAGTAKGGGAVVTPESKSAGASGGVTCQALATKLSSLLADMAKQMSGGKLTAEDKRQAANTAKKVLHGCKKDPALLTRNAKGVACIMKTTSFTGMRACEKSVKFLDAWIKL